MKLIKVLTPVILSTFLAFPVFAAEDQNIQMQSQGQEANAANPQQLATSDESANHQGANSGQKTKTMYHKNMKCKCKCKAMRKKAHSSKKGSETTANAQGQQSQQQSSNDNPQAQQQDQNQANS